MNAMEHFVTCRRGHNWLRHSDVWQPFVREIKEKVAPSHRDARQSFGLAYDPLLRPAGSWYIYRADAWGSAGKSPVVLCRLIEAAGNGWPELYEAKLSVFDYDKNSASDISESIPAHSPDEALGWFSAALTSSHAEIMASTLGDEPIVRVFGCASSPSCLRRAITTPAPTNEEVVRAVSEIQSAAKNLQAVINKWADTDAFRYLSQGAFDGAFGPLGGRFPAQLARLSDASMPLSVPVKRKRGRPIKGGREFVIATAIAELWERCGLGRRGSAPQSRFVRAASVILPWHRIYKADTSQFIRTALAKKQQKDVLIGR